ncbi:GyrI-like domain-containing protein [Thermodesulfobacteriota bacterium]
MEPRIEILKAKKLIGIHKEMSLSNNKTAELWQEFMPRRAEVKNIITTDYISMEKYGKNWNFSPDSLFEKWAAVEVSSFAEVPSNMESYLLRGGKYVVFIHHGPASAAFKTMQYIFADWLPKSSVELDNREHFEILSEGYSPVDPEAKEEIWIPIKD